MGQGALSKHVVQWWLGLNSSNDGQNKSSIGSIFGPKENEKIVFDCTGRSKCSRKQEALQNTAPRRLALCTTAMYRGCLCDRNERPRAPPVGFESSHGSLAGLLAGSLAGLLGGLAGEAQQKKR